MQQPPHGYGPPPSQQGYPQQYGPHGYGPGPGYPPPKRGMSGGMIALIVICCLFGGCVMCGVIGSAGKKDAKPVATAAPDPSAEAARIAAQQKAVEEAKVAKEKSAIETFPTKKTEISTSIKKAQTLADSGKWNDANTELTPTEAVITSFHGTSIGDSKEFLDLESKAYTLRKKIAPQIEKAAKAAAVAAEEKELKASSVVVSSMQLFSDYQANEVAADNKYKGKKLLVSGTVASIDKGPFGGLILRLATSNEFMSTMCDMDNSEKGTMATLSKGDQVRVLCKGHGIVIGTPSLGDCVFK